MRFLAWGDLHYTRQPPQGRVDTYAESVLRKLEVVRMLGEERKVDAHLMLGDIFHRKGHTTTGSIVDMLRAFQRFDKPVYSIWGSHDVSAPSQVEHRAYGCLVEADMIIPLDGRQWALEGGVVLTGWGAREGYDSEEVGEDKARVSYYVPGIKPSEKPTIHLAHGMLMLDPDADYPFPYTRAQDIVGQTARVVVCGHNHTPQKPREFGGCWYVCPGGLGRYSRAERDRDICVAVIEVDGDDVSVDQFSIKDRVGVSDDDWLPEECALVSMDEVRGVAEGLVLGAGDAGADAGAAIEAAAAELGMGQEVVHEARRFLEEAGA